MPRASLLEPAHAARWLRVPTAVVRDQGGARGAERGHSTSVGTSAPSAEDKFPAAEDKFGDAWRAGSGGLQVVPAATRTSPGTLGAGPRAGSSGAGHGRASHGSVVQRRSGIQDELCPLLSSGLSGTE